MLAVCVPSGAAKTLTATVLAFLPQAAFLKSCEYVNRFSTLRMPSNLTSPELTFLIKPSKSVTVAGVARVNDILGSKAPLKKFSPSFFDLAKKPRVKAGNDAGIDIY